MNLSRYEHFLEISEKQKTAETFLTERRTSRMDMTSGTGSADTAAADWAQDISP
jgi:hypothetical protein